MGKEPHSVQGITGCQLPLVETISSLGYTWTMCIMEEGESSGTQVKSHCTSRSLTCLILRFFILSRSSVF